MKDRKKEQPAWMQQAEVRMQPIMLYLQRLGEKYEKRGMAVKKRRLADMDENEAKVLIDDFTVELPRFIGEQLGPKDRESLLRQLRGVGSNDIRVVAAQSAIIAIKWITDLMTTEIRAAVRRGIEIAMIDVEEYSGSQASNSE